MRSNDVDHHCPDYSVSFKGKNCGAVWVIWLSALGVTVIALTSSRLDLILKVSFNLADSVITESYCP